MLGTPWSSYETSPKEDWGKNQNTKYKAYCGLKRSYCSKSIKPTVCFRRYSEVRARTSRANSSVLQDGQQEGMARLKPRRVPRRAGRGSWKSDREAGLATTQTFQFGGPSGPRRPHSRRPSTTPFLSSCCRTTHKLRSDCADSGTVRGGSA